MLAGCFPRCPKARHRGHPLFVGELTPPPGPGPPAEIIFDVREDEADCGYTASALGYGIHTQGETLDELRAMVKDAVACYFDETMEAPKIIRLH